jgi:D-alanine-D-alanine ligase
LTSVSPVATGTASVGVLFGGPSPEHDVSILTGLQAARALLMSGLEAGGVEAVYWTKGERFVAVDPSMEASAFLEGAPSGSRELRFVAQPGGGFFAVKGGLLGGGKERRLELDVVVNCCHGGPGEDGTLQSALDLAGIAYTGPNAAGAALGMDKLAFGGVVHTAGLPSLPRKLVVPGAEEPPWSVPGSPFILKPRFGGSSIGIEVVDHWSDVLRFVELGGPHTVRGMIAEPFHPGAFDVEVAIRGYPALSMSLFGRALRTDGASPILSYRDKYLGGEGGEGMVSAPRELPAKLGPGLEKELSDAAATVATLTGVRGVWRLDFLVEDTGQWWVNEVNTIPGSLAKYLWTGAAAVDFPALLADMVEEAQRRPSAQWGSSGADGSALRSASSIASKLG